MENTKSPKFNIGDKVVAVPDEAWKIDKDHRDMTLTVKEICPYGQFKVEEHTWLHHVDNWMKAPEVTPKYEVGKKYTKDIFNKNIYTCVDLTLSGVPVMTKGNPKAKFLYEGEVLKEYTPKKSGKVWVNIYDKYMGVHSTRERADKLAVPSRIACVEVSWVEGQGLEQPST